MKDKLSVVIPAASLVVILLCVAFQVHLFFGDKALDALKSIAHPKAWADGLPPLVLART